jgi:20S proteasome alpha/beta subunit
MTCIVGVRCSDGVVLAADSVATSATLNVPTIRQTVTTGKLRIVQNRMIVATAGPVGIGQKFHGIIETAWSSHAFDRAKRPHDAMKVIEGLLRPEFASEAKAAESLVGLRGHNVAAQAINQATLIALPVDGHPELIQFNESGTTEHASEGLPFVAIGSGQLIADPFLAFLRRIFWREQCPTVPDGVFAAFWALHHAIETNPGGVGGPIQMAVLQANGKTSIARELPDDVLEEHRHAVEEAEERLRTFRQAVGGAEPKPAEPAPRAPEPPPRAPESPPK